MVVQVFFSVDFEPELCVFDANLSIFFGMGHCPEHPLNVYMCECQCPSEMLLLSLVMRVFIM